jgi:hypothetical protein
MPDSKTLTTTTTTTAAQNVVFYLTLLARFQLAESR